MIGAGFSRLAVPVRSGIALMPLWKDLAERIWGELNPGGQLSEEVKGRIHGQVPRLASQYEALHGRSALDTLLLRAIPDSDFRPDRHHEKLLRLPWSDLFTTNYDTLLERARYRVYSRRYDLVETAQDIALARRPRIVKLHGSFPSHRPFIISDEDYRTYPDKSAPFVNLVQQSLMENALCLLGFSGDDPNFLNWIGWVRDNLGKSAPKLYLCGVLDLSTSERMLMEKRNIAPIDLGSLSRNGNLLKEDTQRPSSGFYVFWKVESLWKRKTGHISRPFHLLRRSLIGRNSVVRANRFRVRSVWPHRERARKHMTKRLRLVWDFAQKRGRLRRSCTEAMCSITAVVFRTGCLS
jgi:hypothetical protein